MWDIDELYDMKADPLEMNNLADKPEFAETTRKMSARMFALLRETSGMTIPLYPDSNFIVNKRTDAPGAEKAAPFPPTLILKPGQRPY